MNKNKGIKELQSGNHANCTNSVQNMSYFSLNIISKLMTEFANELVELAHLFSIVTNISVQAMQS